MSIRSIEARWLSPASDPVNTHGFNTQKGINSYRLVQEFFNLALQRFAKPMEAEEAAHYFSTVFRPLLGIQSSVVLYL